ncbi:MAG: carboxypeptidase-like regulatory domain-containing protein, partial [Thermodesulfobacteriota bacterium]
WQYSQQDRMDQQRTRQDRMDRQYSQQGRMDQQRFRQMESEWDDETTGRGYYDPVQRNPLVERKTRDGLTFINGGVGIRQRNAIEQVEDNFGLKLVFADLDGRYIADVAVDILDDQDRRVFSLDDGGPWLLTDLPPGNYQVRALFDGERKTRRVKIGRDGVRTVIMHWTL